MPTPEFRVKLKLDEGELNAGFDRADARSEAFVKSLTDQVAQSTTQVSRLAAASGQAAKGGIAAAATGVKSMGETAKFSRQELLALNYTASDIAASLASGASPFTILLQQGGQVKDAFGGIGNLASKLASSITPFGVALTAIAAAVGSVAAGYVLGSLEQKKFNSELLLTGNYAALSGDRLDSLSRRLADSTNTSIGSARELISALAATGRVGPDALESLSTTAVRYQQVSGKTTEAVVSDLASMRDGVSRWAQEHNKQLHFLTPAQLQYLKSLEEQGEVEKAVLLTSRALTDHLGGPAAENLGTLERAYRATTNAASDFWDGLKSIGRDKGLTEQIEATKSTLASMVTMREFNDKLFGRKHEKSGPETQFELILQRQQETSLRDEAARRDQAARSAAHERAAAAQDAIGALADQTKGQALLNKEIEKYKRHIQDIRNDPEGGKVPTEAEQAAQIQALREKFNPKAVQQDTALQSAIKERQQAYGDERAQLADQIAQYDKFGHAIDATTRSVLDFDLAHGKLRGTSIAVAAQLRAEADAIDRQKRALAQDQEVERIEKKIGKLRAASEAQALNNREARIATEIADINEAKLTKGSSAYALEASRIRAAVNSSEDNLLARRLQDQSKATDDEISRLQQETRALGQNSLERQISTYQLKLQADARKELLSSPDKGAEIDAAKAADLRKYIDQATISYQAQRSAVTGISGALRQYQEDAANSSKFAADVVAGGLQRTEDALVKFATTGKANFKDLFTYMAEEFLRQQARMAVASAGSKVAGVLGTLAGAYFGSNTGVATTAANSMSGDSLDNLLSITNNFSGRAGGGPVAAKNMYEVNEQGPELLETGGRQYLMMGRNAGNVVPLRGPGPSAGLVGSSTPGINIQVVVQVAADGSATTSQSNETATSNRAARELGMRIASGAQEEIRAALRPGGAIWKVRVGQS